VCVSFLSRLRPDGRRTFTRTSCTVYTWRHVFGFVQSVMVVIRVVRYLRIVYNENMNSAKRESEQLKSSKYDGSEMGYDPRRLDGWNRRCPRNLQSVWNYDSVLKLSICFKMWKFSDTGWSVYRSHVLKLVLGYLTLRALSSDDITIGYPFWTFGKSSLGNGGRAMMESVNSTLHVGNFAFIWKLSFCYFRFRVNRRTYCLYNVYFIPVGDNLDVPIVNRV